MRQITIDKEHKYLSALFEGDFKDEEYKSFWLKGIELAKENKLKNIYIDQMKVGKVSFMMRAWVVIFVLPMLKKELGEGVVISVLLSENNENSARGKYLLKIAKSITGFQIYTGTSKVDCVNYFKK